MSTLSRGAATAFALVFAALHAPNDTANAAAAPVPAVAATPAATSTDGKAEGTLTVNGTTTKVAYAYAREVEGFFDKTKKDVEVILSDVPLDAKALSDQFARGELADQGKIHTFEIIINSEGKPISTMWRHNGFKGPTPSGLSTADVFTAKTFDGKLIEASYKSKEPAEFFGNTSAFDVSFRAAVTH